MKSHIIRLSILGTLIILCIWQTTLLWLGDTSSHNFLGNTISEVVTQPKEIWVNNNGLAYKIDGDNDESRLGLITELSNEIKKGDYQLIGEDKYTYSQLLSRQGFVYEYGTSLSIDEIFGTIISKEGNKKALDKVTGLFIDISEGEKYRSYIYLIGENQEVIQKLILEARLELHNRTIEHYSDETKTEGIKTYQASLLHMEYSKAFSQNVFYPLNNHNMPIIYKSLKWQPIITGETREEEVAQLEAYVNTFFKNPLYKEWTVTDNGIVFSDSLNMNVRYSDIGVMEFKKLITGDGVKLSALEQLNKVNAFIAKTPAIPQQLKKGLYLKEVTEDSESGEQIYRFGYRYEGFEVLLTDEVRRELKIDEFLELAVKSNEVVRGSWLMLDLVEQEEGNYSQLYKEGKVAIEETRQLCNIRSLETTPLGYLECAYRMDHLDGELAFNWAALYEDKWYFP